MSDPLFLLCIQSIGDVLWQGIWHHLEQPSRCSVRSSCKDLQQWVDSRISTLLIAPAPAVQHDSNPYTPASLQRFHSLHSLGLGSIPCQADDILAKEASRLQLLSDQLAGLPHIKHLSLLAVEKASPDEVRRCCQLCSNLTSLNLNLNRSCQPGCGDGHIDVDILPCVTLLQSLRELQLVMTGYSQLQSLAALRSMSMLTRVECSTTSRSNGCDISALRLTQLLELDLNNVGEGFNMDWGFRPMTPLNAAFWASNVSQLTRLTCLRIREWTLTNPCLQALAQLPALRTVAAADVNGDGGGAVMGWTSLTLEGCKSRQFPLLRCLRGLQHIRLGECHEFLNFCYWREQLVLQLVRDVRHVPSVQLVGLSLDSLSSSIAQLAQLTCLDTLHLWMGCMANVPHNDLALEPVLFNATMGQLVCLTRLTSLEELCVGLYVQSKACEVLTLSFLPHLAHLPHLRHLCVDLGLASFFELPNNSTYSGGDLGCVLVPLLLAAPCLKQVQVRARQQPREGDEIDVRATVRAKLTKAVESLRAAGTSWSLYHRIDLTSRAEAHGYVEGAFELMKTPCHVDAALKCLRVLLAPF